MEHHGLGYPAMAAEGTTTMQPERDLNPGDPNLIGAAPKDEKTGIAGKVKHLMGRHGRKRDGTRTHHEEAPQGLIGKMKAKAGVGHGAPADGEDHHGPARLLTMSSSSSSMSSSDEEDIGTVGHALDPTGPAVAGANLGRQDFASAPEGPGADFSGSISTQESIGAMKEHNRRAAEFAMVSNPLNPNRTTGEDVDGHGEPHQSHPTQSINSDQIETNGGENQGTNRVETTNLQEEEPRGDNVK